jgi:hypothetical protein
MGRRSQRWSGSSSAGLISVQVVGEASSLPTEARTMDIECPGGAVIRLREDVSEEVLERVMAACQPVALRAESRPAQVRSC